jgi:hypothetical protein
VIRALGAVVILGALAGCAARLWVGPMAIDDYASVRVRIYHVGRHCRIDVIAATETIQTPITRCAALPHRARTN